MNRQSSVRQPSHRLIAVATTLLAFCVACSLLSPGSSGAPGATEPEEGDGQAEASPPALASSTQADLPTSVPPSPEPVSLFLPDLELLTPENAERLGVIAQMDIGRVLWAWFAADASKLAAVLVDENWRTDSMGMWDLASGGQLFALEGKPAEVFFSPDGSTFALTFPTEGIETYDSRGGERLSSLEINFNYAAFSPTWELLAVSHFDGETSTIRILNGLNDSERWSAQVDDQIMGLEFTPDGQTVYAVISHGPGVDSSLQCWVAMTGQACTIPPIIGFPVFSPDGQLAAGQDEWFSPQGVRVYDAATWKRVSEMRADTSTYRLSFSSDGQIVGAEVGYRLKLWESRTGEELVTLPDQIINFQFSPDGRLIAAWDSTGGVILYGVRP